MASKKQITITLPNKVGELARLTKKLKDKKVNIEAISVSNLLDCGVVRFVPSNIKNARSALAGADVTVSVDDVVAVALPDQVGALADAAAKLQKAKINIDYVYGSTCSCTGNCSGHCDAICVFKTSDLKKTEQILSK
ncbi:amino acid-binding protein [bacterium]|nr:amino acid-binding protein [bacterium]